MHYLDKLEEELSIANQLIDDLGQRTQFNYFIRARCYMKKRIYDLALKDLEKLNEDYLFLNFYIFIHKNKAEALFHLNKYELALEHIDILYKKDSDWKFHQEIMAIQMKSFYRLHKYQECYIVTLKLLGTKDSESREYYEYLWYKALCLKNLEKYKEAIDTFEKQTDQGNYEKLTQKQIASCYMNLGEFKKAFKCIEKYILETPDSLIEPNNHFERS